eukprot:TRINITY_DN930_c0_g1_i1.p1 TRINITY_DN930_c0_g1~~TRINITY_DN930_c0_g1_i1.p1  ORF type:complete len:273 (+),score=48.00 TRINITY_DN930_c0_g1_i1:92-820(+)
MNKRLKTSYGGNPSNSKHVIYESIPKMIDPTPTMIPHITLQMYSKHPTLPFTHSPTSLSCTSQITPTTQLSLPPRTLSQEIWMQSFKTGQEIQTLAAKALTSESNNPEATAALSSLISNLVSQLSAIKAATAGSNKDEEETHSSGESSSPSSPGHSDISLGKRKRGRKRKDKSAYFCHHCLTRDTPGWRKGPNGPNTLCNACGLQYAKRIKLAEERKRTGTSDLDFLLNKATAGTAGTAKDN